MNTCFLTSRGSVKRLGTFKQEIEDIRMIVKSIISKHKCDVNDYAYEDLRNEDLSKVTVVGNVSVTFNLISLFNNLTTHGARAVPAVFCG